MGKSSGSDGDCWRARLIGLVLVQCHGQTRGGHGASNRRSLFQCFMNLKNLKKGMDLNVAMDKGELLVYSATPSPTCAKKSSKDMDGLAADHSALRHLEPVVCLALRMVFVNGSCRRARVGGEEKEMVVD